MIVKKSLCILLKIHIKFISLVLAFKAVNNSAHTFLPTSPLAVFANLVFQLLLFVSLTQDFVLGFLPAPGLPTSVMSVCIYTYITYCYIVYIYVLSYAYIKCDLPFNCSLKLTSYPKGKSSIDPFTSFVIQEFIPE